MQAISSSMCRNDSESKHDDHSMDMDTVDNDLEHMPAGHLQTFRSLDELRPWDRGEVDTDDDDGNKDGVNGDDGNDEILQMGEVEQGRTSQTCGVSSSRTESPHRSKKANGPLDTLRCSTAASEQAQTTARRRSRKVKQNPDDPVYSDIIRCQICGDKASGMHYGVYSCEGCKGFFRRTQRLKIEYKPCPYWGQPDGCIINIGSRNKCRYCRYQKCLSLGMSSGAVRMGRVPKEEVKKLKEELDEKENILNETEEDKDHRLFVDTINEQFNNIVRKITQQDKEKFRKRCSGQYTAHMPTGAFVVDGMKLDMEGPPREITSHAEMARQCFISMEVFIEKFATYAKQRTEFRELSMADQLILFKGAALETYATNGAKKYYHGVYRFPETNTYIRRDVAVNSMFGQDTTWRPKMAYYEMFNELGLTDKETAVYCTFLLYTPDREGLVDRDIVERHQELLAQTLYRELKKNHLEKINLFAKLMDVTVQLRSLIPDHMERLNRIKMRCNGHLPADPSPLLNEVYGGQIFTETMDEEDGEFGGLVALATPPSYKVSDHSSVPSALSIPEGNK